MIKKQRSSLLGTLKVHSIILTKASDRSSMIVITSPTFLKRKDLLKENRQLAQIIKNN